MSTRTQATQPVRIEPEQQPVQTADRQSVVTTPKPSDKTPEEFYAEITRRPDVCAILEELAQG